MSRVEPQKQKTLSLTVKQFIQATEEYPKGRRIEGISNTLEQKNNVVPTFYLKRIKTQKYYYTFCTPEATIHIIKYLKTLKKPQINHSTLRHYLLNANGKIPTNQQPTRMRI